MIHAMWSGLEVTHQKKPEKYEIGEQAMDKLPLRKSVINAKRKFIERRKIAELMRPYKIEELEAYRAIGLNIDEHELAVLKEQVNATTR